MSDYYDDLYFGGSSDKDTEVGCPSCGLTCIRAVDNDNEGEIVLVDPGTGERHTCGKERNPRAGEGTDDSTDGTAFREVEYIDYE